MFSHKRSDSLGLTPVDKRKQEDNEEPRRKYRRFSAPSRLKDTHGESNQDANTVKFVVAPQLEDEPVLPEPMFLRHQLVGDSLLLRFAEQVLNDRCKYENGHRFLGLCVSGQTIRELKNRVTNKFAPVAKNIILLIGTNDMTRLAELEDMIADVELLIDRLQQHAKKIVILTLPPVPKLVDNPGYEERFTHYNKFLLSLHDGQNIFVINITKLFLEGGECNLSCYERYFDRNQQRPDMIHLNRKGLLVLCDHLRAHKVIKNV